MFLARKQASSKDKRWKLMKVGELASCNRGQADVVIILLHCLIRITLHQFKSWKTNSQTDKSRLEYCNIAIHLNCMLLNNSPILINIFSLSLRPRVEFWQHFTMSLTTDHVWWTDEGSSRCWDSSSPSSCPVYTGSHVMGWTVEQTLHWHTGSWHRGPASCCHCPPHTDAKSADVDCKSHRLSMSLQPLSSLCWPE